MKLTTSITVLMLLSTNLTNSCQGVKSDVVISDTSLVPKGHWVTDVAPVVNLFDTSMLLLLSNDVETNPGPESVGFEKSLCDGLAKLCQAAPSDTVRSVLSVWSPTKPGNEIRAAWSQGKRFLAPSLKGTLAWLTNTRESEVKGTRRHM